VCFAPSACFFFSLSLQSSTHFWTLADLFLFFRPNVLSSTAWWWWIVGRGKVWEVVCEEGSRARRSTAPMPRVLVFARRETTQMCGRCPPPRRGFVASSQCRGRPACASRTWAGHPRHTHTHTHKHATHLGARFGFGLLLRLGLLVGGLGRHGEGRRVGCGRSLVWVWVRCCAFGSSQAKRRAPPCARRGGRNKRVCGCRVFTAESALAVSVFPLLCRARAFFTRRLTQPSPHAHAHTMAGWLRYWMHRVCFESVGGRKETKKNTAPKRRRLTKKRKTKTQQEPIITWSFIIGGIGESGSVAKQEGRGEKRGWRARRPFVFLRSTARRVDRALNHPLPSLSPFHPFQASACPSSSRPSGRRSPSRPPGTCPRPSPT
jgi:hypothetical protein